MKIYDIYKRLERYLLWVALLIIGASSYVNMHQIKHMNDTHDEIEAAMRNDREHHNTAVAEHKALAQHNDDQDARMEQMVRIYRSDLNAHIASDKAVERRLHNLELTLGRCK